MQEFLEDETGHDLRVLSPYLFGTTLWGAQAAPGRSALLPCLHDEPYARLTTVRRVMGAVRGGLFNAPAEERLARRIAPVRDGGVVGMGFDPPAGPPPPPPAAVAGPRPLPRLRRAPGGGQARAGRRGPRGAPARASARTGPRSS